MRIQHNIMAMSAYRNYNTNTSALAKNLEKLSSGYKINRAGDDAAGLAISEKMRAQITGLNAASKNVKDGISLVKTAEGAMQEIQDMLNRMDYLATQSANGTYQDAVDRENLNKEMENLKTEINRIADSANFNGIKLLDGSLQEGYSAKTEAQLAADQAQAAADAALAAAPDAKGEIQFGKETSLELPDQATNNTPSIDYTGNSSRVSETILETDYEKAPEAGFSISFNGVSHTFKDVTSTTETEATAIQIAVNTIPTGAKSDLKTFKITEKMLADAYKKVTGEDAKNGDVADGKVLAEAFATAVKGTLAAGDTDIKIGYDPDDSSNTYSFKVDGESVRFTATNHLDTDMTRHLTVEFNGVKKGTVAATANSFKTGALTQTGNTANKDATVTVEYTDADGKSQKKDVTFASNTAAAGSATALINALKADADLKDLFDITGDNNGVTLTAKTAGADNKVAVTNLTVKTAGDNTVAIADGTATEGTDAFEGGTSGYLNSGTQVTVQAAAPKIDQLASTTIELTKDQVVDGATLRLGDQKYIFAIGEDSAYKDAEGAVYVDGLKKDDDYTEAADGTITLTDKGLDKMLTKLAEVAKDNETFSVSHTGAAADKPGLIGLKQLQEVKDSTDMSTMEKLSGFIGLTSVDKDATEKADAAAVEAAKAEAAKLQAKADELKAAAEKAVDGKPLNLQIGDTSDSFNQMKVSVGNMHVEAMKLEGEDGTSTSIRDIDILTSEKAQSAVDVIKNAINYVSSVRGDLGAYQNRLEHTANNLSVMAENIQDAESTIRDTDIAEEMMSYTKNNILVQSAQAMLAQANAVPQGVLQLLG